MTTERALASVVYGTMYLLFGILGLVVLGGLNVGAVALWCEVGDHNPDIATIINPDIATIIVALVASAMAIAADLIIAILAISGIGHLCGRYKETT